MRHVPTPRLFEGRFPAIIPGLCLALCAAAAWGQPTELEGLAQLTPGRTSPSVDCPLVDFFCDPAGTRDEVNTAMVNERRGFNAYFPVQFQKPVLGRTINTRKGSNEVISIIE
jgi:hypothetical protein